MEHRAGHRMGPMMLICGAATVAAIVIGVAAGRAWLVVAPLFCAAMMIGMVWMMASPAIAHFRHRDGGEH